MLGNGFPVSMYAKKTIIDMWRFNVLLLKEFLALSVSKTSMHRQLLLKNQICFLLYSMPSASRKEISDISEILLKVALKTITISLSISPKLNAVLCTKTKYKGSF